jgi:hypothetical protein
MKAMHQLPEADLWSLLLGAMKVMLAWRGTFEKSQWPHVLLILDVLFREKTL